MHTHSACLKYSAQQTTVLRLKTAAVDLAIKAACGGRACELYAVKEGRGITRKTC